MTTTLHSTICSGAILTGSASTSLGLDSLQHLFALSEPHLQGTAALSTQQYATVPLLSAEPDRTLVGSLLAASLGAYS